MKNDLLSPCSKCPFRRDANFYLHPGRVQEIAATVTPGGSFVCHQTIDYGREGDDEDDADTDPRAPRHYDPRERLCAGALAFTLNTGDAAARAVVQIRLGCDSRKLAKIEAARAMVFLSLGEWLRKVKANR